MPPYQMDWPQDVVEDLRIAKFGGEFIFYRDGSLAYTGIGDKGGGLNKDGEVIIVNGNIRMTGLKPYPSLMNRLHMNLSVMCNGVIIRQSKLTKIPAARYLIENIYKIKN